MVVLNEGELLRQKSLDFLWMQNRDWTSMAEDGDPLVVMGGEGIKVTDSDQKVWIDVNGGYNSVNVGYGRSEIAEAAYDQMLRLPYFPQGTTTIPTIQLAQKLADITPGNLSRSFPVSGGSEANETALKIARAYHRRRNENSRYKVISRKGSYHGTTGGVLWLGGNPAAPRSDFEPEYPGMIYAPQPNSYRCELGGNTPSECAVLCAEAVEQLILQNDPETIAAFIAEPIATPLGCPVPGDEYWPMIREICKRYGVLLIVDEVICGFGRTGKMFALEHWGVVPDIMTVAKGISSSYLPLAATVVSEDISNAFAGKDNYLRHVFTSSGHPVSAAAALKNIEIIEKENLVKNAATVGKYFKESLLDLKSKQPLIGDVRGLGLLLSVELVSDSVTKKGFPKEFKIGDRLNGKFRENGLILRVGNEILNLGPPLCITELEVDEIIEALDRSLTELQREWA
jgi:adenosylmethionine-8-amino-7-oxononanoate aminotransferase